MTTTNRETEHPSSFWWVMDFSTLTLTYSLNATWCCERCYLIVISLSLSCWKIPCSSVAIYMFFLDAFWYDKIRVDLFPQLLFHRCQTLNSFFFLFSPKLVAVASNVVVFIPNLSNIMSMPLFRHGQNHTMSPVIQHHRFLWGGEGDGRNRSVYTSDLAWHWCAKSSRGNHMLLSLPHTPPSRLPSVLEALRNTTAGTTTHSTKGLPHTCMLHWVLPAWLTGCPRGAVSSCWFGRFGSERSCNAACGELMCAMFVGRTVPSVGTC